MTLPPISRGRSVQFGEASGVASESDSDTPSSPFAALRASASKTLRHKVLGSNLRKAGHTNGALDRRGLSSELSASDGQDSISDIRSLSEDIRLTASTLRQILPVAMGRSRINRTRSTASMAQPAGDQSARAHFLMAVTQGAWRPKAEPNESDVVKFKVGFVWHEWHWS